MTQSNGSYFLLGGEVVEPQNDGSAAFGFLIILAVVFGTWWFASGDDEPIPVVAPAVGCQCRHETLPTIVVPLQLEEELSPAMKEFLTALVQRVNGQGDRHEQQQ